LKILPPTGGATENGISNGKFYFPFIVLLEVEFHKCQDMLCSRIFCLSENQCGTLG